MNNLFNILLMSMLGINLFIFLAVYYLEARRLLVGSSFNLLVIQFIFTSAILGQDMTYLKTPIILIAMMILGIFLLGILSVPSMIINNFVVYKRVAHNL